jgi:hypothetical protein
MKRVQTLSALFSFPGFRARSRLQGIFGDPPGPARPRGPAKTTAVCSGCGPSWPRRLEPAPRVIGVDELSIKKGHTARIVVSELERGRPIWVGSFSTWGPRRPPAFGWR